MVNYTRVNNRFFIYFVANGLMYVQVCIRSVKFRINKRVSYIHVQSLVCVSVCVSPLNSQLTITRFTMDSTRCFICSFRWYVSSS